jgi:hypothetical protein
LFELQVVSNRTEIEGNTKDECLTLSVNENGNRNRNGTKSKWIRQILQQQMILMIQLDSYEIKQFIDFFEYAFVKCEIDFVVHLLSVFTHVIHQEVYQKMHQIRERLVTIVMKGKNFVHFVPSHLVSQSIQL